MSIKEKHIKLLWGRAANRCSFANCRVKLSHDKKSVTESFLLGEQAHIVGKEVDSARSKSILSPEERDSYHNLILLCPILLCPSHHTLIDKNPEDFPVEKLHMIKAQHEDWVESTLSDSNELKIKASDIIYAHLIDLAVEGCSFDTWENWMSGIISPSHKLRIATYDKAIQFTLQLHKAVLPGTLPELESSLKHFAYIMNLMLNFYINNAKSIESYYVGDKFYKAQLFPQHVYHDLLDKYEKWEKFLDKLIFEAVKAANWFADVVRKEINPLFFATNGKFSVVSGPDMDLSFHTIVLEYTNEDKKKLIESSEDKLSELDNEANLNRV